MGALRRLWAWGVALCLLGGMARAAPRGPGELPPDGSFLRVQVRGGLSPFTSVTWDVSVRGDTVVLSLVKESLCRVGQQERVRLLQGADAQDFLTRLAESDLWLDAEVPLGATPGRARDLVRPSGEAHYEVWSAWGRQMTRWVVPQGAIHQVPEALRIVLGIRKALRPFLEPLPMRDLYYPPGRIGYLTVTGSEEGEMVIDGWDRVPIPVESLEVVEGEHQIVATGRSGKVQRFRVQVVAGAMQRVHILFADPDEAGKAVP